MEIFRIKHNIEEFLPTFQDETERRFSDLQKANLIFESLAEKAHYSNDEWISLDVIEIKDHDGELVEVEVAQLRFFSDDTKVGVNFNPKDYEDY
ncbi:MAG: hypothetical protein K2H01_04735 [Ruminococcus sp.]|nr:hypothetical protein [Ruminococcus sp.]